MNEIVIEVQDFTKTYGDFVAVDKISFNVKSGEIFGLLGPNGAGKTSTLECLEGLREPSMMVILSRVTALQVRSTMGRYPAPI